MTGKQGQEPADLEQADLTSVGLANLNDHDATMHDLSDEPDIVALADDSAWDDAFEESAEGMTGFDPDVTDPADEEAASDHAADLAPHQGSGKFGQGLETQSLETQGLETMPLTTGRGRTNRKRAFADNKLAAGTRPTEDKKKEDKKNAYDATLEARDDDSDLSDMFKVSGWIVNSGDTWWDDQHALGVRNFRDAAGNILKGYEFRGQLSLLPVPPGQEVFFTIAIAPALLPPSAVSCDIDMVHENYFWFEERGATPITVPITGFRNANSRNDAVVELLRISKTATVAERRKISVLTQVLRNYDFLHYEGIARLGRMIRLRQAGKPYRPPVISSTAIAALQGRNREGRHSAYFDSFASKFGNFRGRLPSNPVEYIDLFKRFVRDSNNFFRGSAPPLPPRLTQWLGARALPAQLASSPVSRSIMATLGDRMPIHFNRQNDFINLMWAYITSVMIDNNLPVSLVPDSIVREFATSPETWDTETEFPQPTGFMARLRNDDAGYQRRYDASNAAGRCAYAFDLLLLGLENEARRLFVGQTILDWMTQPIGPSLAISPFEILVMANLGGRDIGYFTAEGEPLAPEIAALRASYDWLPLPAASDSYPLRVIGRARNSSGLGTNMRMTMAALDSIGVDVETVDSDIELVTPPNNDTGTRFARPIEIYHLNCDEIPTLVSRYSAHTRPGSYRIGFALWESSVMPEQHRGGATLMDELWVPTTYLQDVYRNAGFGNVHVMGKGIDLGPVEAVDRATYGIHEDDFIFVTSFDIDSWVERKNPAAVVEAFARAFPNDPNVRLVVKTTGIFAHPGDRTGQIARVLAAADADPRILLINERMPFPKYLGIIQMADALISAHRSEGFGYLPAYAMLLSRPVITTNHSGTEDFCTEETSFPVASKLTPIPPGDFVYDAPGACWADIDIDALAEAMQKVRQEPLEAERRAKAGYDLVSERYSMDALAKRYKDRLAEITA
ncbi:glycosyltransferase family 4 protein [Sphingobium sp. HBC34]|uniref:Glycosyltransferase family 4 protein n=1 Tax=Sphingobium cyanobacteriorum TaxID=3063954 RepID=A0ABT8ZQK3_9SPHN|nr:glycosyltransferase family 4 protein [Sphingobium sp. HBC34]MDO7836020.1 glycosyltransferase family 4 protein [Sphingobium sp. HBC34]